MSNAHEIVRRQFDGQAMNFSNWSVTRNIEYQKAYFDFCGISDQDTVLDFACAARLNRRPLIPAPFPL